MGLVRCKECHQVISSSVQFCPHCGYQYNEEERKELMKEAEVHPVVVEAKKTSITEEQYKEIARKEIEEEGDFGIGIALGFLLSIIGLVIAVAIGKKKTIQGSAVGIGISVLLGLIVFLFYYFLILRISFFF